MARIPLTFACTMTDRVAPLLRGEIQPDGIDFITTVGRRPGELFLLRMKANHEFDCCEMGMSLLLQSENPPWTGIPIFTSRHFFHVDALVNVNSGIKEPADLEGKRVGLASYGQVGGVWARGVWHDEFDIRHQKIRWFQSRDRDRTSVPDKSRLDVELNFLEDVALGEALLKGDLDALVFNNTIGSLIDKPGRDPSASPNVKQLFEDPVAEIDRYYKKTGVFPMNHTVSITKQAMEKYPWAPTNIFLAFEKSKKIAYEMWKEYEVVESFPTSVYLPYFLKRQKRIFGDDAFPNGIRSNQRALDNLARYMFEQKLIAKPIEDVADFFATSTRTF